jgi:Rad3-related DNA helicase
MAIKQPYKLYDSQKKYITDILKWFKSDKKFLFLEGPTGMGKTISNLMTAVKFIKDGGKVIYFTREHTQIEQCFMDLKLILEKNPDIDYVKALHISGLSQACLRPEVLAIKDNEEQSITCEEFHDNLCNYSEIVKEDEQLRMPKHQVLTLMPEFKHLYYDFNLSVGDTIANTMNSMDHMVVTEHYELEEELFKDMMVTNDKIVQVGKKYTVCPRKLQNLALKSANIIFAPYNYLVIPRIKFDENIPYLFIIDEAHNLDQNLTEMQSFKIAKKTITSFVRTVQMNFNHDESFQFDVGAVMSPIIDILNDPRDINGPELLEFLKSIPKEPFIRVDSYITMKVRRSIRRRTIHERSTDETREDLPRSFITIHKFLTSIGRMKDTKSGIVQINDDNMNIKFMDADAIFKEATKPASKVIVSSGTLFPNYMQFYMGMTREMSEAHEYQPPHVNLRGSGMVVSKINKQVLSSAYKKRSIQMAQNYADLIIEGYKKLKGGMLVFFTSYPFRDLVVDLLPNLPIYYPDKIKGYRKKIAAGENAIFMSAMRGKGSEGWNFPDDQSRMTFVIGIPYQPMDITVKSQIAYYNKKRPGLGDTWYKQKAVLWLVQVLGRTFRHKDDYGKIFFADMRVTHLRKHFPKWTANAINWTPRSWERTIF